MLTGILIIIALVLFGVLMVSAFVAIFRESWRYAKKINRLADVVLDDEKMRIWKTR